MNKNNKQNLFKMKFDNKGFSLVELLVVISIIGTLAGLLITNLVGVRARAEDTKVKSNLNSLKTSLRLYYNDYQQYPASSNGSMLGCGADGATACTQGGAFSAGSGPTVYMQELPDSFGYSAGATGETFLLSASLNNASDTDIEASATACGQTYVAGSLVYYVCND